MASIAASKFPRVWCASWSAVTQNASGGSIINLLNLLSNCPHYTCQRTHWLYLDVFGRFESEAPSGSKAKIGRRKRFRFDAEGVDCSPVCNASTILRWLIQKNHNNISIWTFSEASCGQASINVLQHAQGNKNVRIIGPGICGPLKELSNLSASMLKVDHGGLCMICATTFMAMALCSEARTPGLVLEFWRRLHSL